MFEKLKAETVVAAIGGFVLYVVADWAIRHWLDKKFPSKGL